MGVSVVRGEWSVVSAEQLPDLNMEWEPSSWRRERSGPERRVSTHTPSSAVPARARIRSRVEGERDGFIAGSVSERAR